MFEPTVVLNVLTIVFCIGFYLSQFKSLKADVTLIRIAIQRLVEVNTEHGEQIARLEGIHEAKKRE